VSRDFTPREFLDSELLVSATDIDDARRSGVDRRPDRSTSRERSPEREETRARTVSFTESRVILKDLERAYRLAEPDVRTLIELGKFRVIAAHDLAQHIYSGEPDRAERSVSNLVRQGLVRKGIFNGPETTPRRLLTLTERGHRLLERNRLVREDQATYSGFVNPREANHDADLYRVYQQEAIRIEEKGGRHLRVVLALELKKKINRDFAKFGRDARPEIAKRYGLAIVRNKIPLPDVRIEYETPDGDMARVNLELVTAHYDASQIREKADAGFSLYTPHGEGVRLRRILDQQELTAEIFSL
jgi:hypothetical protein